MRKLLLRFLLILIVLAGGAGHWYLSGNSIEPIQALPARSVESSVEPLPLLLACPGAFVEVGGADGTDLGALARVGEALISSQGNLENFLLAPELASTDFAIASAAGKEQSTALLSMIQAQSVDRARAIGIQSSYCSQPTAAGWLINGSAVIGSESVLIAANPQPVEALVDLEIHLSSGIVSDRFALAPGEEQLISLARYANGEERFAVSFVTNGPEVLMALQNRETRGLTPIGVELGTVAVEPSSESFFVGLRELTGGFTLPELEIFNPSDIATEVSVSALDGDNVELFRVLVQPGQFATLDLNVSPEYQLVKLQSEQPVFAAIKSASTESVLDFAWLFSAERFRALSLPLTSYQNSLVLSNPEASPVELTIAITSAGKSRLQTLVLPGLGTVAIPVSGTGVTVSGSADFLAAIEILDPAGYSVVTPRENSNLGNNLEITIY